MTEKSECKTTLFFYYKIKLGMMHLNVECRYHLYCMRCKLPDMPYTDYDSIKVYLFAPPFGRLFTDPSTNHVLELRTIA